MAGVNKVILVGNLGKDPQVRALDSGRKVANFTLATSETYKDRNGQKQESTEWHNVSFWGPVVDVIERYLTKGSQIYMEGRLQTRSYQDKEGQTKYITEVVGQQMTMLGGRGGSGGGNSSSGGYDDSSSQERSVPQGIQVDDQTDDLPF